MTSLPEDFITMLRELLGEESQELIKALDEHPPVSVRLNRRKSASGFPASEPVKWCPSGFYLSDRPDFIFDPLLHAGAYYVQDASSMIYEALTEKITKVFEKENPGSSLNVLDLCAAPGGKTTAMINGLPDGCKVTANEYTPKRVAPLKENLSKWGYDNLTVTNKDSAFFAGQGPAFDIVAVDAPCSGEGMMRKDEFARKQWSSGLVEQCSSLQKEILTNAVEALKEGGFLIYSTCTFNRKENEENAEFIAKELGLVPWNPDFSEEWNIPNGINAALPVFRFMPHKTKGEGLFLAVFRKPGDWHPSKLKANLAFPKQKSTPGTVPEIEDILSCDGNKTGLPKIELDRQQALAYLRRESLPSPDDAPKGIVILTYNGLNLGAGKNIGSRINNLYPKNWRILKR